MSEAPRYVPYHPKWYRRRVSVWWWLQKPSYAFFVLRELTSVGVAAFALILLWQLRALVEGPEGYARILARLQTPAFLALHLVIFVLVMVHAITWFNLTPKAMVVRVRATRVPDRVVAASNYVAWLAASGLVTWILLRG